MTSYKEACEYIDNIPKFAPKTELGNTRALLGTMGNPTYKYRSIHIAGTNGKGSVAKMTALMLKAAGFKVGLFISPHLQKMNERISVNGEDISDEGFVWEYEKVLQAVRDLNLDSDSASEEGFRHPAYFEFLFMMAADYYAKEKCDFVVWETGLGGRLDATNTVYPEVSIITSIGMDHMQYLGNTIEKIAGEKAGIIKKNVPVIYNTGNEAADKVIKVTALKHGAKDVNVADCILPKDIEEAVRSFAETQTALYQADNARTAAVAIMELFTILERDDAADCIARGLHEFFWPGRMEEIAPGIIIDGAHNEDAIRRFIESAKAILAEGKYKKLSLIFGVCEDKDYESIIRELCLGLSLKDVYVTEIRSTRKTDAKTVVSLFQKYRPAGEYRNTFGFANLESAWTAAAGERDDETLLMAVGSLYLIGEIKDLNNPVK